MSTPSSNVNNTTDIPSSKQTYFHRIRTFLSTLWINGHAKFVLIHLLIMLVIAIVFLCYFFLLAHFPANNNKIMQAKQYYINQTLTDMQGKLSVIEQELHANNSNKTLNKLENDLHDINQHVQDILQSNTQVIESSLQANSQQLQQQLATLTHTVSNLQQSIQPISYLSPKALPFKVLSIDDIESVPVITIIYHDDTFPIEKGESIADWQVVGANYEKQTAEFINDKQQHVIIRLGNKGE